MRSQVEDIEQPLLEAGEQEAGQDDSNERLMSSSPKRWPQLRLSSVSTRRLSPAALSTGAGDGLLESLLSPHPSGAVLSPFSPAGSTSMAMNGSGAHPFHTNILGPDRPPPSRKPVEGAAQPELHPQPNQREQQGRYTRAAVTGTINVVVALPVMGAFAAIIFRDPFFHPMMGSLVKLVFLSSAIHMLAFATFSTLPFAVGQVQDVGLIFLSSIATSVVALCGEAGWPQDGTLATALATLTLSTGVAGLLIICTGALKLASLVQYVPLPVIGGYLCFVGYFCLTAGVSLATGLEVAGLASWAQLADGSALVKLAPALAMVLLITAVLHRFRSPIALPVLLLSVPLLFYAALHAFGLTLEDAREAGWVAKQLPGDSDWRFWKAWRLYGIHDFPPSNIYWQALPPQVGKLLALFVVVAFGSSLDIAAIQADSPRELDYNAELVTVGLSNLLAAGAGVGFTGSYIFSQTLFSMRMGVDTPLMGIMLAAAELAVFAVPVNVMTYLPNFYFGGLTAWIGQDILKDWLFIAAKRISGVEYALLLATFALVMAGGLEAGIAGGIVLAALHFAYSYSRVTMTAFTVVPSRSDAVRTFDQRTVLDVFAARITAVSLQGYLFFGSSVSVVERVLSIVAGTLASQPHLEPGEQAVQGADGQAHMGRLASLPSSATLSRTYDNVDLLARSLSGSCRAQLSKVAAALAESPRFLILDFRRVQGLDATAARSFVTLHNRLQALGIQLILTHMDPNKSHIRKLLAAQGLPLRQPTPGALAGDDGPMCLWFPSMDAGCHFCEEHFLAAARQHGLCPPQAPCLTLAEVLRAHLELPRCIFGTKAVDYDAAAAQLERFTEKQELRAGEELFALGSASDCLWVLECGAVTCRVDFTQSTVASRAQMHALPPDTRPHYAERRLTYGPGSIVGELDFFLQRPRSFPAVVEEGGSAWRISRRAFEAMSADDAPSSAILLTIILRSTSLSAAHAIEAMGRSSAS